MYLAYKNGWRFEPVKALPTLASAIQIGNPVSVQKAIRTLQRYEGIVEQASEEELSNAAARADRTGMFNCPHTGVALAVLLKLRQRGEITFDQRVVIVSTASGLKFTDFKVGLITQDTLAGVASDRANRPVELPNDLRRRPPRHRPARLILLYLDLRAIGTIGNIRSVLA